MMTTKKTISTTIAIPEDYLHKIKAIAYSENQSIKTCFTNAVKIYLDTISENDMNVIVKKYDKFIREGE